MKQNEIIDQPIPLLKGDATESFGSDSSNEAVSPTTHLDKKFPSALIARETISQSLNTKSKRILSDYTFESQGAFSVYSKTHPLANIKISGEGIVATDANGEISFALDGETGDAIFRGKVVAGEFDIIDEDGLISSINFPFSSLTLTLGQDVTVGIGSPVDVTGATFSITSNRIQTVLFLVSVRAYITRQAGGNFDGNGILAIKIDGESIISGDTLVIPGKDNGTDTDGTIIRTYTLHRIKALSAGDHIVKIIGWIDQGSLANAKLHLASMVYSYVGLGN